MTKRSWKKPAVAVLGLSLLAAACGDTSGSSSGSSATTTGDSTADSTGDSTADSTGDSTADSTGDSSDGSAAASGDDDMEVTITGSERDDPSVQAINEVLTEWGDANGIKVTFVGDADWEANVNTQVAAGNPPDISVFPQPGKLASFADEGNLVPVSDEVQETLDKYWDPGYQAYGQSSDGGQYGVPVKTDLKSLVWYQPARWEAAGLAIPTTYDEFLETVDKIKGLNDGAPLCVGIESGQATGWPFTDWTEEMVLRQSGPDVYDQWVAGDVKFSDPKITGAMQSVLDLWNGEGNTFAASGTIAATAFGDNAQPLIDGQCWMHRQANFFGGFFPEGTKFADGSEAAIDVFYFPDINGDKPVLTAGAIAAAFNDNESTMKVLNYMGTAEYAQKRQAAQSKIVGEGGLSGYLSAAKDQDQSVYTPIEQNLLKILGSSEISRFDGSDLMPPEVGAGTFWSEGTAMVNGDKSVEDAAAAIDASWPAG